MTRGQRGGALVDYTAEVTINDDANKGGSYTETHTFQAEEGLDKNAAWNKLAEYLSGKEQDYFFFRYAIDSYDPATRTIKIYSTGKEHNWQNAEAEVASGNWGGGRRRPRTHKRKLNKRKRKTTRRK
jgi:hypothetical protein